MGKDQRAVNTGWYVSRGQCRQDFTGAFSCLDSDGNALTPREVVKPWASVCFRDLIVGNPQT